MMSKAAQLSELIRLRNPANKKSTSKRRPLYGFGKNDADYMVRDYELGLCPAYVQWANMLKRAYSSVHLGKYPTYTGCSVSPDWLSFSEFRKWWIERHVDGWAMDKDMAVFGNLTYSPDACVFVPVHINGLLVDRASDRGEWPIGVSYIKSEGRFKAQCCDGSGRLVYLGRFNSPKSAVKAWKRFKVSLLNSLKAEMDAIDGRMYGVALKRILSYG